MMRMLKPLLLLILAAVSLTACAMGQLTSDQTTRLSELQAFADQIAQDWASVTVESRTQLGLIPLYRLSADRPIYVDQWMPFVRSYRVVIHPEFLSTKWCAELTVAHGLEWARHGIAGGIVVGPAIAMPLIVLGARAAQEQRAEKIQDKVVSETGARLRQVRGWTDTEFRNAVSECQVVVGRLKFQERQ
jgi:hypothetical protein